MAFLNFVFKWDCVQCGERYLEVKKFLEHKSRKSKREILRFEGVKRPLKGYKCRRVGHESFKVLVHVFESERRVTK